MTSSNDPIPKPSDLGVDNSTTRAGDVSITTSTPAAPCRSAASPYLRSWREFVQSGAFSLPPTLDDAFIRIRTNLSYFAKNYTDILFLVLILLSHSPSYLVLFWVRFAWEKFYFSRDAPLLVFGEEVGKGVVVAVLSAAIIGLMLLTGVGQGTVVFVAVMVLGHAVTRKTDDLYVEEAAGVGGGGTRDRRPLSP